MAGAFDAKVDISTREATEGLRTLRKEVKSTADMLKVLDGALKKTSGDLTKTANDLTKIVAASRAGSAATKEMAQAEIAAARASSIRNVGLATEAQKLAAAGAQEAARTRNLAQGVLATTRAAEVEARRAAALDRQAASTRRAAAAHNDMSSSMSNSRYLMYDVGATYGIIAAALMAIPAATAAVAAAYQRDFAQVVRVNENLQNSPAAAQGLKDSLKTMATDMPIAFDELSKITQLGAQMGVADEKLAAFTETTAKFIAVTGISAQSGSQLFGRLETSFTEDVAQFPDFFDRVGSSIAYVGAKTVATDPEIAAMMNQIGSLGAAAGMSASQTVGLAAALASVRVQPELARGTLTRIFGQFNRDVADGSPRLAEYGKVMGTTAAAAAELWDSNPSEFFQNLIKGLNETHKNGGKLTTIFDDLGIKASRDVSALTKLAVGYDVLALSMDSADKGFQDGTALDTMSEVTFETVIAKLTEMANAWKNLGDTLGAGALGPLAVLVDTAKNLAMGIDGLVKHVPAIGALLSALMGFATITAMFLGFKAAQAFVTAGFIGFQQASARGVGAGLSLNGTLRQLSVTMLMTRGVSQGLATQLVAANGAVMGYRMGIASLTGAHVAALTGFARMRGGVASFSASLYGMVGGPIGIAIAAIALLSGHMLSTAIEAEAAGKAIADGLAQGADAGMRAVAKVVGEKKVGVGDGIFVRNNGKTVAEIANETGIGLDKMISSISKGKDGVKEFDKAVEDFAVSKGYKSLQDMALMNPNGLADGDGQTVAKLVFLKKQVAELGGNSEGAAHTTDILNGALTKLGVPIEAVGDEGAETAGDIKEMEEALKGLNDEVFATINSEASLAAALAKLGEGLYEANHFSPQTEGGRDNLENVQDTMTKAREYYTQMMNDGTLNAQEAAQGYSEFIDGLFNELRAKGADTSYIDQFATNTRERFAAAIGGDKPIMMKVEPSVEDGLTAALATRNVVQSWMDTVKKPTLDVMANVDPAQNRLNALAVDIAAISGLPFEVVMDALTDPASEKAREVEALLISITTGTYVAPVDADTTAAIANVQNFVAYARTELSRLQTEMNGGVGYGDGEGSMSPDQKAQYGAINAPTRIVAAPRQVRAPAPTKQTNLLPKLGGVADGYNKAAEAAKKAGKEGKKAGEDIADGIDDAVKSAEDFGNRLKTALMSAYNQQHGLNSATDAYHTALNGINKKREDELKQLDDLRDKVKALNNERDKELISANKAKIEQNISVKYGETDRAADYGNQAQTSLDNAAAKQKEIDANAKETQTLAAGIGNLTGYSDAAIANREALRGLEAKMIDMVAAYAATGASQSEVAAYTKELTLLFQADVAQMGYNQIAVNNLSGDLGRYIGVIMAVPEVKPTKVTADTAEATGVMNAFDAAMDRATRDRVQRVTFKGHLEATGNVTSNNQPTYRVVGADGVRTNNILFNKGGQVPAFNDGGLIPGRPPADPSVDNLMAKVDGKGLIKVRSREFIEPEEAVDYYGLDAMEAIRTLRMPKFNMGGSPGGASGNAGGFGSSIVGLDAETLAALASFQKDVKLYVDGRELADSVNRGNKLLAAEGSH